MAKTAAHRSAVQIVAEGAQKRPLSRQLREKDAAARAAEQARPSAAAIAVATPSEDRAVCFQTFLQNVLTHHADWRTVMTATQISSADIVRARTSFDAAIANLQAALLPAQVIADHAVSRDAAASPYFTEEADSFQFMPSTV